MKLSIYHWRAWMNGAWAVKHMHPYERFFAALRDRRWMAWYLSECNELRCQQGRIETNADPCPVGMASGSRCLDQEDDDAAGCFGMSADQAARLLLGIDGCDYPGSGYEDLARKLRHFLGVQS